MIGYQPFKNQMYVIDMFNRIKCNPTFKNVFKKDLTKRIMQDLKDTINPEHLFRTNFVINFSGTTGSSKSISIISLGLELFKNFSEENVFFFDQDILDNVKKFPKDSFVIRDENPAKAIFGIGSDRTPAQINILIETVRKYGLNFAFVEPNFVQTGTTKYIFETVDMDVDKRINRIAVRDIRSLDYIGAIYLKVVDEDNPVWVRYNEKKDSFIQDILKGSMSKSKMNPKNMAQEILDEIDLNIYKTKKERKVFIIDKFPNYTSGEIDLILTHLELIMRQDNNRLEKV